MYQVAVPAAVAGVLAAGLAEPGGSDSAAGVLPLKKWMYTNGPAAARTTRTPMASKSQRTQ